jgi:ribosome-binding protein aMBF1 (putative translation factor)
MNKKHLMPSAELVQKLLRDPEIRINFELERARTDLAAAVQAARKRAGLTQKALAEKVRTSQSVIARLESGTDQRMPSLPLLAKIAKACHGFVEVTIRLPRAA